MVSGRFRGQYDLLIRQLRKRKKMTFAELCMLWNVGPDRARRLVKSMSEIDRHLKISKDRVEWEDEPYKDILADLELEESEEIGLEDSDDSKIEKEKRDDQENKLSETGSFKSLVRERESEK